MIKTISIYNHKSFHPTIPQQIRLDVTKTATYIYGLNGAGKSAIGEVIDGISRADPAFDHCAVETTDDSKYRYLVYNQDFADRVIGEPMRGIFTVGEIDTVRKKRIDEIVTKVEDLEGLIRKDDTLVYDAGQKVAKEEERAKDEVWKVYNLGKQTKLAHMLQGYGRDSKKFFQDLRTYELQPNESLDSLERLEQRWLDASSNDEERSRVIIDTGVLVRMEEDSIWYEAVNVSSSSRLAPLVAELRNADWVSQGQPYIHTEHCPFCQQTLPHDFKEELTRLLEGERKAKVDKISALVTAYTAQVESLEGRIQAALADPQAKETGLDLAWSKFHDCLQRNLALMRSKQTQLGEVIAIESSNSANLSAAIFKLNVLIDDFNSRISDRKGEQTRIRKKFYQFLFADRAEAYARHDAIITPLRATEENAQVNRTRRQQQLRAYEDELRALQRQQKGVDASISAINDRLQSLGITAFSIKLKNQQERLYCLNRPGVPNSNPLSLSEGEKTLIAFLYFMEFIKGAHEEDENVDPKKTIAVIDDPISSLSQNFVYDIATMIHRELAKPEGRPQLVKQVIVLTHNLFFFHELVRQQTKSLDSAHRRCGMLRIIKNEYSQVQKLDPAKIMNDYDIWWQVLKDAKNGVVPTQIIPNAMRSILEQFFTFTTGSSDFPEAVHRLSGDDASSKYRALDRFVDRGSHKDGINGPPIDWTEYDVEYLLGKFRAMFVAIGQESHFLLKMGDVRP